MIKDKDSKEFIKYLKSLGLSVHTNTKARGNRGFYIKNRIDISKDIDADRLYDTLVHEFAHYIHSKIEPIDFGKKGSLNKIFDLDNVDEIKQELEKITDFIDSNSRLERLFYIKAQYKNKIKEKEEIIKKSCPDFQRSKAYKPFDKAIRGSKAKYLLKYDRVRLVTPFLRRIEQYSIDTAHIDFPELKPEFIEILKLKSLQRKQANNSRRINRYKKYYNNPTELFARFVQSLSYDEQTTKTLAPKTCSRFYELLDTENFSELKYIF